METVLAEDVFQEAFESVRPHVPECIAVAISSGQRVSQRTISRCLDNASREEFIQRGFLPLHMRAHLNLVSSPGADAWLHAPPSKQLDTKMAPELFRISIASWLRMPLLSDHGTCPMCGTALDVYMDHALVCSCGGDRTLRHNSVRNCTYKFAQQGDLHPEREKACILPPRPSDEEGPQTITHGSRGARRPADIWLPRGPDGGATAVDFAVTSGLRNDRFQDVANDPSVVFSAYEEYKRSYLNTAAQCYEAGVAFIPFVIEAHGGGLSATSRRVCGYLASAVATAHGKVDESATTLLRGISIAVHRENARAKLRRFPISYSERMDEATPDAWVEPSWQ